MKYTTQIFKTLLTITFLGIWANGFSQSTSTSNDPVRSCSTTEIHLDKMANDPVYKKNYLDKQARAKAALTNASNSNQFVLCNNPVLLPMAVHFQGIGSPDVACLRALAANQIQILNDDYQGLNSDISNWINTDSPFFPGVSYGETCVEFCLATQSHPAGYGLVDGDPAVTINEFTGDNNADWSGYINIFVRSIGALGYSPLGGDGDGDGVTIDVAAFGSGAGCSGVVPGSPYDLGRTLTHELGHYMNLGHIWGGGCGSDDGIADTPDAQTSNFGCPALGSTSCGSNDMHMNYMDYTNDACMYMFSAGQSTVMENYTASNLGIVSSNSAVCIPPGPTISFTGASTDVIEGTTSCVTDGTQDITLTLTIGAEPSANAVVTFSTTGSATSGPDYTISPASVTFLANQTTPQTVTVTVYEDAAVESDEDLTLSYTINANGGDAVAGVSNQTHLINIYNDDVAPSNSLPVTLIDQNFDGGLGGWTVNDGGSNANTWTLSSSNGGLDGSQYIIVDSDAAGSGSTSDEELLSPVFDGTSVTGLTLDFDQYIRTYSGGGDFNETFDIDIWDGSSWQNVFTWGESDGNIGGWGSPDHQTINISAHAHANNQLRFTYVAEWDYWWVIDNVEVSGIGNLVIQTGNNVGGGYAEYDFGPNGTIHYYDDVTGNIMMTIVNNTAHDYGCTHVEVDRGSGAAPGAQLCSAPESEFVTDKTFRVIPEFNNPTGNYTISLYYTSQEISGWAASSGEPIVVLEMVKAVNAITGASTVELATPTVTAFGSDYIYTATYGTGFSGFALGNPGDPLPVELVHLSATPLDQSIVVNWSTASEINNRGFELLRSTNPAEGFTQVLTWVDGMGTTSALNTYRYEDYDVDPGVIYYYRLNQIDHDGTNEYSDYVSGIIDRKETTVSIQPNPVVDVMTLQINSPSSGHYSLFHSNGQLVASNTFQSGDQQLSLNLENYARGVYWIVVQTEEERIVRKVVLGN